MKVSIWVEEKDNYIEVSVAKIDIASVIAKRYGIPAETMLEIINDYDIDLDEEIDNNDDIKELAENIYWRNR